MMNLSDALKQIVARPERPHARTYQYHLRTRPSIGWCIAPPGWSFRKRPLADRDHCRCRTSVCRSRKLRAPSKGVDKVETRAWEIQRRIDGAVPAIRSGSVCPAILRLGDVEESTTHDTAKRLPVTARESPAPRLARNRGTGRAWHLWGTCPQPSLLASFICLP